MATTARKLACMHEGFDKASFSESLQHLSDQLRRVDQKLTMKVDETIEQDYNVQHKNLEKTNGTLKTD